MDVYSTHLKYLELIIDFCPDIENVVEFGMGYYSTKLFVDRVKKVTSIEMQTKEWFNKIESEFKDHAKWTPVALIGPFEFLGHKYPEKIDLVFVDGHGDSRPECINFMVEKRCRVIVAHDTEEQSYRWDKVAQNDYMKLTFKDFENWTTCWTLNPLLYEHLKINACGK